MLTNTNEIQGRNTKAKGVLESRAKRPKISIQFDAATFDKIAVTAIKRKVSFASVVRELIAERLA